LLDFIQDEAIGWASCDIGVTGCFTAVW